MRFPHGDTVILHRFAGTTRNAHGQTVTAWAPDESVPRVAVAPGSSTEAAAGGSSTVVTQLTIYLPPGVTVSAQDQVTVRGERYSVDGDKSGEWVNPFTGWSPGSALALKRVTG
jgi:hypothetical protein